MALWARKARILVCRRCHRGASDGVESVVESAAGTAFDLRRRFTRFFAGLVRRPVSGWNEAPCGRFWRVPKPVNCRGGSSCFERPGNPPILQWSQIYTAQQELIVLRLLPAWRVKIARSAAKKWLPQPEWRSIATTARIPTTAAQRRRRSSSSLPIKIAGGYGRRRPGGHGRAILEGAGVGR